jgi:hypothetical protein
MRQRLKNIKNKLKNYIKEAQETKDLPKSKLKRATIDMITVLSICGISLLGSTLPAIAKDKLPTDAPKPDTCVPAPSAQLISDSIIQSLEGAAGVVCALAISSGSFVVGGLCKLIVVIGILKVQGK